MILPLRNPIQVVAFADAIGQIDQLLAPSQPQMLPGPLQPLHGHNLFASVASCDLLVIALDL